MKIDFFAKLDSFELFGIIQFLVNFLGIATIDDIESMLHGLFNGHIVPSTVKQIVSILVGSGRLVGIGEYGHYKVNDANRLIMQIKDGAKNVHDVLKLDLSTIYLGADPDFISLLGA